MFIDDLKKSILQKAIQGKLVEQNPNDEPASELLKRIREEKEKLIKDGKIKKEKGLLPITDEEKPFDIPSNWGWTKIEEISYPVGNKFNQIQSKEVLKEGKFPAVSQGQALIDGYSNEEDKVINDLPLIMFGDHTRNVKYIDFPFVISADGTKFFKPVLCDYRFVFYLINYSASNLRNRGYARHYSLLKETWLPLPPLEEQKRIVAKLDELMPLLDEARPLEEEITKLEKDFPSKLRQSILQYAIQGKLVEQNSGDEPASELLKKIKEEKEKLIKEGKIKKEKPLEPITDEEKLFDIPSNWEWVRIGEIFDVTMGQSPEGTSIGTNVNGMEFHQGKIYFSDKLIQNSGIQTNQITKIAHPSSILLCMRAPVGKVNITDREICIGRGLSSLLPYTGISLDYSFYVLQMLEVEFIKKSTGSTFKAITGEVVKEQVFPLPPLEEQKRIVAKLDELMKLCDELEEQIG